MPKGFYSQCTTVLFRQAPPLTDVEQTLSGHQVVKKASGGAEWQLGGPSLVIPFNAQINGYCAVDVVDHPWPDAMGDPKTDPVTFSAWSMGHFGPFTWPGALTRAMQQCWNWPTGASLARSHAAFVRVRHSYVFGAAPEAPLRPRDYEPGKELRQAAELVERLLCLPGAIAAFNPNGECINHKDEISQSLNRTDRTDMQEIWCNVRMYKDDHENLIFDTKGLGQMDLMDHELAVPQGRYDPNHIVHFLRNAAWYVITNGEIIKNGNTMDGPGNHTWRCSYREESRLAGPRRVISWNPDK